MLTIQNELCNSRQSYSVRNQIAVEMTYELDTDSFFCTMFMAFSRNRVRMDYLDTINYMRMRSESDTSDVPDKDKRQKCRLKICH